jgi:ABC-type glycerol-3-phosphate transport system substrate-binding protein
MRRLLLLIALCLIWAVAGCQAAPGGSTATAPPPSATQPPAATATDIPATAPPPTATATLAPTATQEGEGQLDYTAAYGGAPAWEWDKANVARYQQMNPDLEVDHLGANLYASPVPNAFYLFLDSDRKPDVMSGFVVGSLREYVARGEIADISELWQEMGWEETFPASIRETVTINGSQYFVPMALQWNPVFYRTDIFDELELAIPQTWEELIATCDALDASGYIPFAVSTTGWMPPMARFFSILNMRLNGPEFHEQLMAGEASYDDPRVRAVFEHWSEMFAHNCFSEALTSYGDAAQQIFDGEAAMYFLGEWLSESYDDGLPETFDFFSFPSLDPDVPRGEIVHVYGAYLLTAADHPEEGRAFLKYLGGAPSQTTNVETLGRVASNLEVDPALYDDVYRRGLAFVQEADHITTLFEFNVPPEMAGQGLRAFSRFWQDQDIDSAISTLETARLQAYSE